MRAIRIQQSGGPEVLEILEVEKPSPGPGQVLVRNVAIGLNFLDIYHRSGLYPQKMPFQPGTEAAGVVEAVGEGVTRFKIGDPAVYGSGVTGAYADFHVVAQDRAYRTPAGIDAETAAAVLIKGMTAEFLLNRAYPVKAGEAVLIHAAAGGVGQIMVQWAKALGAFVIGTVGSQAKAEYVRGLGADHVLIYGEEDFAPEVRSLTGGKGVAVAYDSVGAAVFESTLGSLAKRGMLINYGSASGPMPTFDTIRLGRGGSLYLHRPALQDYVSNAEELDASAGALFQMILSGQVKITIGRRFAFADVRAAHEALASRDTLGSSLLIP